MSIECTHVPYRIAMHRDSSKMSLKSLCSVIVFMAHVLRAERLVTSAFGMMPRIFFTEDLHRSAVTACTRSRALLKLSFCRCYSPIMKMQFQVYASSVDNDPDSVIFPPLQTTGLRGLASQIDSRFKSSRGSSGEEKQSRTTSPRYELGVGKNPPVSQKHNITTVKQTEGLSAALNWNVPEPAMKKPQRQRYDIGLGKNSPLNQNLGGENFSGRNNMRTTTRLLPKGDELSARLTKAVWDEEHFVEGSISKIDSIPTPSTPTFLDDSLPATSKRIASPTLPNAQQYTITGYQQIDLSIPPSVYSLDSTEPIDLVWDLMRQEAYIEAAREPLLVSFLYSTILNHPSLESALSFHLANRLSSPTMLSTQIMFLIREAFDADPDFRRSLRADILAVRDRDPACNCLPDVFLYFKGFHALQTYRVAHYLWKSGRRVLAHYLQSQVSQHFQIDIRELKLRSITLL
jgi:hypothetical protein